MSDQVKCPYCAEPIQREAIKCKHCGEWLAGEDEKTPDKELPSTPKVIAALISFAVFVFFGYALGGWLGVVGGIFLWLVAAGSIATVSDISAAGEAARRQRKQDRRKEGDR